MRLPRDVSGARLAKPLGALGYEKVRQDGSHIRLTTEKGGTHHITIPAQDPIKLGTLASILKAVAAHHNLTTEELPGAITLGHGIFSTPRCGLTGAIGDIRGFLGAAVLG